MEILKQKILENWIYDIETLINLFTYYSFNIETKEYKYFVIHKDWNDFKEFIKHLKQVRLHIGFNNLAFDDQIIQYILDHEEEFSSYDGEQLANTIYNYAQYIINLTSNNQFPPYPEWELEIASYDLFKIWHFDNKAKSTSLKAIEYMLDMDIEEMPISHYQRVLKEQIVLILSYNKQDIIATYKLYLITIGDTDHPLYKGVDKIQLRKDIQKEFGLNCLNYNDVRIGDALNKQNYCRLKNINRKEIPRSSKSIKEFTFGDCFPEYIKFETQEFKNFVNLIKNIKVKIK